MKLVKGLLLATVAGLLVSGSELVAQPKFQAKVVTSELRKQTIPEIPSDDQSGFINWIRNHKKTAATLAVTAALTSAAAYYLYQNDMLTVENAKWLCSSEGKDAAVELLTTHAGNAKTALSEYVTLVSTKSSEYTPVVAERAASLWNRMSSYIPFISKVATKAAEKTAEIANDVVEGFQEISEPTVSLSDIIEKTITQ